MNTREVVNKVAAVALGGVAVWMITRDCHGWALLSAIVAMSAWANSEATARTALAEVTAERDDAQRALSEMIAATVQDTSVSDALDVAQLASRLAEVTAEMDAWREALGPLVEAYVEGANDRGHYAARALADAAVALMKGGE